MRSVKRSVALSLVALAAGGAVSLGAAGAAQASPSHDGVAVTHERDRDRDRDHDRDWGRDRHDGRWDDHDRRSSWQYAGTYRSWHSCEKVGYLGEISHRWRDSKCVGGGWGGVKLFVKRYGWGG
ncbi:hypothetical protein [Catenuloplanes atrovinosus]|uniref:Ni/Co efflux regulator RcnB n=1 Tax=Catenuloplanes atrovinosus TaxID=137266 RepID=A0AAE3YZD6_9ACTN|nr:hypothetical protein [Catenuloplanes atrovinosus]MDR7281148.1 Ni/Co efflux regulator RcnB [Catenuloplanes atrovinosus]